MSPIMLEQQLNLSRRACCYTKASTFSSDDVDASVVVPAQKRVAVRRRPLFAPFRSGICRSPGTLSLECVSILVLFGVLLFSLPAPTLGRPNGTATTVAGWQDSVTAAVQDTQPNVSIIWVIFYLLLGFVVVVETIFLPGALLLSTIIMRG